MKASTFIVSLVQAQCLLFKASQDLFQPLFKVTPTLSKAQFHHLLKRSGSQGKEIQNYSALHFSYIASLHTSNISPTTWRYGIASSEKIIKFLAYNN